VAHQLLAIPGASISAQVLVEFYVNAIKPGRLQVSEAVLWIERLSVLECTDIDIDLVIRGIALSRRFAISYWDGAIIAGAERLGAPILYTEDLNHGQIYGSVKAINPFKGN
jgi:predicted nucleic acid-binding protein